MFTFTIMKLLSHKNRIIIIFLTTSISVFGQDDDVTPPPPPGSGGEDVLPIDGGVFILLAISILFGLYKLYQYKQQKKIPA